MAKRFDLNAFAYAHRGLWSPDGPPENSRAAFEAAAAQGLGGELDVRPASDGVPVIFHDFVLDRMTEGRGLVCQHTSDALTELALNGTNQTLPRLSDLLSIWPTPLPLLIELKIDGVTDPVVFTQTVLDTVSDYAGLFALMSFSPEAVEAIPETYMRGQLIAPKSMIGDEKFNTAIARAEHAKLDYLALRHEDAGSAPEDLPLAVWTVDTLAHLNTLPNRPMGIIFEHLDPTLVGRRISS